VMMLGVMLSFPPLIHARIRRRGFSLFFLLREINEAITLYFFFAPIEGDEKNHPFPFFPFFIFEEVRLPFSMSRSCRTFLLSSGMKTLFPFPSFFCHSFRFLPSIREKAESSYGMIMVPSSSFSRSSLLSFCGERRVPFSRLTLSAGEISLLLPLLRGCSSSPFMTMERTLPPLLSKEEVSPPFFSFHFQSDACSLLFE